MNKGVNKGKRIGCWCMWLELTASTLIQCTCCVPFPFFVHSTALDAVDWLGHAVILSFLIFYERDECVLPPSLLSIFHPLFMWSSVTRKKVTMPSPSLTQCSCCVPFFLPLSIPRLWMQLIGWDMQWSCLFFAIKIGNKWMIMSCHVMSSQVESILSLFYESE